MNVPYFSYDAVTKLNQRIEELELENYSLNLTINELEEESRNWFAEYRRERQKYNPLADQEE